MKISKYNIFLILIFCLGLFVFFNRSLIRREFKLTEKNGVVYKERKPLPEKMTLELPPSSYKKNPDYVEVEDKSLPFTFFYPKDLAVSFKGNGAANGFEEYFTLPPVLGERVYSYPGMLTNPEKTENNRSLFIRIINFNGSSKNTESWLEDGQKIDKGKIINANGISFSSYLGLFGQKYNQLLVFSNGNQVGLIMLFAKDEPSFGKGREMLNVIISSLKWKYEKNNL